MVSQSKRKVLLLFSGLILLFGLTLYDVFFYSYSFAVNSDNMYFIHAAEDVLTGNILLRNWNGGYFTALTGDILWAAVLRPFLSQKAVLYLIGPLACSLIALFSLLILNQGQGKSTDWKSVLLLLPVIFIPSALRHAMMTVGMHAVAIAHILILVWLLGEMDLRSPDKRKVQAITYVILLWAGCLADGFVLYYFAFPAILALVVKDFRKNKPLLILTVLGALAGTFSIQLLNRFGFLQTESTPLSLVTIENLGHYILNAIRTWFLLFGWDISTQSASAGSLISGLTGGLAAITVMVLFVLAAIRFFQKDTVTRVLLLSLILNFGSFTVTNVTWGEPAVRYLSPAFFTGILVAAKTLLSRQPPKNWQRMLVSLPLLLFALGNVSITYHAAPVNNQAYVEIGDALKDRGVKALYATYWETHALSYYAGEQFVSAPIMTRDNAIIPYRWSSKKDWYETGFGANCILVSQNKKYGLSEKKIVDQFGPYREHLSFNETDMYFYDKNLSGLISDAE